VFFVGDSAGHCLPTTAEGIRPAFHFALALGRELRGVLSGEQTREQALASYGAFSDAHRWKYDALLRVQDAVGRLNPRPRGMRQALTAISQPRLLDWMFRHYLAICPPEAAARAAAGRCGYGRVVAAVAA
jgi:flavin-dependent dehydrogenase